MKCIKAIKETKEVKLGEIKRVDDKTAFNMVGTSWAYVAKSEWKMATRDQVGTKSEPSRNQVGTKSEPSQDQVVKKKNPKQDIEGDTDESKPFKKTRKKEKNN